jgi:hypothetical protein
LTYVRQGAWGIDEAPADFALRLVQGKDQGQAARPVAAVLQP